MNERTVMADELSRWKCTSYCRCATRRGHFERSETGEWMLAADVLAHRLPLPVAHGTLEGSELEFDIRGSKRATNRDLRAMAALLIAAANKLAADPGAVDTRIEA